jgi:hypothetical protein
VFAPYYAAGPGELAATSKASGARYLSLAGRAITWNGSTWSAPRLVDPAGGGLTAVSCPVHAGCVAADFDGRLLRVGR